jgi:hypothetical protein
MFKKCFYCEKTLFKVAGYIQVNGVEDGEPYEIKYPLCKKHNRYMEIQSERQKSRGLDEDTDDRDNEDFTL